MKIRAKYTAVYDLGKKPRLVGDPLKIGGIGSDIVIDVAIHAGLVEDSALNIDAPEAKDDA